MIIDHHNHVWEGESTGGFLDESMSVGRILRGDGPGGRGYVRCVHRGSGH